MFLFIRYVIENYVSQRFRNICWHWKSKRFLPEFLVVWNSVFLINKRCSEMFAECHPIFDAFTGTHLSPSSPWTPVTRMCPISTLRVIRSSPSPSPSTPMSTKSFPATEHHFLSLHNRRKSSLLWRSVNRNPFVNNSARNSWVTTNVISACKLEQIQL